MKSKTFRKNAMYRFALAIVLPLILTLLHAPLAAAAVVGYVNGTAKFPNNSLQWCDSSMGMDCTGAMFPASEAQGTPQPIKDSWLLIQRPRDDDALEPWVTIGGGYTNALGEYNVVWTDDQIPTEWRIVWRMEQRDQAFRVADAGGETWTSPYYPGLNKPLKANGQTVTVNASFYVANEPATIYGQAWRAWNFPLKQSTLLWSYMWGVQVRWPVGIGTSAATDQAPKIVKIEDDGWQGSIQTAHELGHVASYVANPFKPTQMYNWPTRCRTANGICLTTSWSLEQSEWGAAAFEEGLAEFIAMGTHYWFNATGPATCFTSVANCDAMTNSTRNVEVNPVNCIQKAPLSVVRFLWDTYDNIQDASYADTLSRSFASAIDNLGNFPNSTSGNGKNAPWNSALTETDNEDGRAAVHYANVSTTSVSPQRVNNCAP